MSGINFELFGPMTLIVFAALGVLSFISITITLQKIFQFSRLGVGKNRKADTVLELWLSGKPDEAMALAAQKESILTRVLQAVFTGMRAKPDISTYAEELGRQTALVELSKMSTGLRFLEMIVQAAPMLGLLGTVIGMIDSFSVLSLSENAVDSAALAGGIWTALTTTAAGLMLALVTFFIANWFESKIDRERNLIEVSISAAIHGRVDPLADQNG